jgi:nucleoid DNA-binding protein
MDDKVQTIQYFDVTRQEVRDWWSDTAAAAVHEYSCDGIFVDGATAGRPDGTWNRAFGRQNAEAMDQAVFAMLKDAREKMGPDKLIIFNPLHGTDGERPALGQEYLPVTDGAMVDDFDRGGELRVQSKEYMASTIETMQKAAREGNVIIFKAWPGFALKLRKDLQVRNDMDSETIRRAAREDLTFPLACFLVGAEANCFFCYTWGWEPEEGTFEWYPEFDKRLGPPEGHATRTGWVFRRQFKYASVFVDLEKRTARINWK